MNFKKNRVGLKSINNQGLVMEIIEYNKAVNIKVRFEDGTICRTTYQCFVNGSVKNNNINNRINMENLNNQGLKMKIIGYKRNDDIDVLFEDGFVVYNKSYDNFLKGNIKNPNFNIIIYPERKGEVNYNKYNEKMTIISYNNYDNVIVEVQSKNNMLIATDYRRFLNGQIKTIYSPAVFNKGYIGIVDKKLQGDKNYQIWHSMMERCYCDKFKSKHPTYKDCIACDEWLCFSTFDKWCNENYYTIEGERIELDKDILFPNNKIYSPETCIFVPKPINILFQSKRKSKYMEGVHWVENKNCFLCNLVLPNKKTTKAFKTEVEAYSYYVKNKEQYMKYIADKYKNMIPQKLYDKLIIYKVGDYHKN